MKKLLTALTLSCFALTANAEYQIRIPLEQAQGGQLPNGSIKFKSSWEHAPAIYGDWVDQGLPYDCNNWYPAQITVPKDQPFTQTATDCSQDQTRTAQDQEVNLLYGVSRAKGEPYTQSRTITVSSTRDSVGTQGPWEQFADERGLSKTWNDLIWAAQGLSYLPNAPYPITSVYRLYLYRNQLTNVDGLSNLTSVAILYLYGNQLTNVDGLSNLTSVGYLYLYRNQLTSVNGLANVKVSNKIMVDETYSGPKLAANARFCTDNPDSVFPLGYAQKSQLCESP